MQPLQRRIVSEIEVERRDGDKAVSDRLEVRLVARRLDHWAKSEPVIIITPRILALHNAQSTVVAQPLAADADTFHILWEQGGEIYVDQRPRLGSELQ